MPGINANIRLPQCALALAALAMVLWTGNSLWAQVPAEPGQAPSDSASTATAAADRAAAVANADAKNADDTAKAKLLASPEWKAMYAEFQKWLNAQPIYTPADIKRINANLAAQINAMPASEVQAFLDDWQAKLKVLRGEDFQDAQQWLGLHLSVLADGFRRQTLQSFGLSDIVNMTAVELEESIVRIRARQFELQRRSETFDQTRRQQVQSAQQRNAEARQSQLESRSRAAQFGTNQSPYRPKFNPPPPPRTPFFVDGNGRVGFFLPF